MLVLSQKVGDKIYIGDSVVMTLVRINGDRVRVGFDAPKEVPVNREEVHQKILEQRREREQENRQQGDEPS